MKRVICLLFGHRYVERRGPQFVGCCVVQCTRCFDWYTVFDPPIVIPPHSEARVSITAEVKP